VTIFHSHGNATEYVILWVIPKIFLPPQISIDICAALLSLVSFPLLGLDADEALAGLLKKQWTDLGLDQVMDSEHFTCITLVAK
jgi:hypothetical protein